MLNHPSLSRGKKVTASDDAVPTLKAHNTPVIMLHQSHPLQSMNKGLKVAISFVAIFLVLLTVVYIGFSATLMTSVPKSDKNILGTERLWVVRNTFIGGEIPAGTTVYASSTSPKPEGYVDKFLEGILGTPNSLVGTVIAGPNGELSKSNNSILVDGKDTGYSGDISEGVLNKQYLISSDSKIYVISAQSISGEVTARISPKGIERV